jgi:hypothetical protein
LNARDGYCACQQFCANHTDTGVWVIVPTRAHLTNAPDARSLAGAGTLPSRASRRVIDLRLTDRELAPASRFTRVDSSATGRN